MIRSLLTVTLAGFLLAGCGGGDRDLGVTDHPPSSTSLLSQATVINSFGVGTVSLPGTRDSYTIVRTTAGYTATNRGTGVATPVSGVATFTFTDATVNLDVGDLSKTIDAADLKILVELYIAFFNRIPDAEGMTYWIGRRRAGDTLDQIAASFYGAAISPDFSALTGYNASMSSSDFVSVIYKNVLGRSAVDAEGMAYWTSHLADGSETRGSLVRTILASAHTFKGNPTLGFVADLLDNKYTVGSYFALQQGITFRADVFSKSSAIALAVTPANTSTAMQQFALVDSSFNLLLAAPTAQIPTFAAVQAIVNLRCVGCHAARPSLPGFNSPPAGIIMTSAAQIRSVAGLMYMDTVLSQSMPFGNATAMTDAERRVIGQWFDAGAP